MKGNRKERKYGQKNKSKNGGISYDQGLNRLDEWKRVIGKSVCVCVYACVYMCIYWIRDSVAAQW